MKSEPDIEPLTTEELRQIREDSGLTKAELACLFGLSDRRVIRRYESELGDFCPSRPVQRLYHLLREGKLNHLVRKVKKLRKA